MNNNTSWSKTEKEVAREAFDLAYQRECEAIKTKLEEKVEEMDDVEDIWQIEDFLSSRRKEVDKKYDYRYSNLVFLFGRLIVEGWLTEEDIDGLDQEKIDRILMMKDMADEEPEDE